MKLSRSYCPPNLYHKRFPDRDLALKVGSFNFVIPANKVKSRRKGKITLPRPSKNFVAVYEFRQGSESEYVDITITDGGGKTVLCQRVFATGEFMHLPVSPDVGVCEYCGDKLPVGQSLCGECAAQVMARGIDMIDEQESKELEAGFVDVTDVPGREGRLLRFCQWLVRHQLNRQIYAINAEVLSEQIVFWVYMRTPFIARKRRDFTEGVTSWLKLALLALQETAADAHMPLLEDVRTKVIRHTANTLAKFRLEPGEIPQVVRVIFTTFDDSDLAQSPGRRIYSRKAI